MAGRDDTTGGRGDTPSRQQGDGRADEGFGDDGGTRVGRPDTPQRANAAPGTGTGSDNRDAETGGRDTTASDRANTGAGAESGAFGKLATMGKECAGIFFATSTKR